MMLVRERPLCSMTPVLDSFGDDNQTSGCRLENNIPFDTQILLYRLFDLQIFPSMFTFQVTYIHIEERWQLEISDKFKAIVMTCPSFDKYRYMYNE